MLRNFLLSASLVSFAAVAPAQQCATLGITVDADSVAINLDGPAPALGSVLPNFAFLVLGDTLGTLPIDLGGLGGFTLGVLPNVLLPLGATDAAGDVALTFPNAPVPPELLQAQGLILSINLPQPPFGGAPSVAFSFCTSNVVAFSYGSGS
jgi:hypothetical protein